MGLKTGRETFGIGTQAGSNWIGLFRRSNGEESLPALWFKLLLIFHPLDLAVGTDCPGWVAQPRQGSRVDAVLANASARSPFSRPRTKPSRIDRRLNETRLAPI